MEPLLSMMRRRNCPIHFRQKSRFFLRSDGQLRNFQERATPVLVRITEMFQDVVTFFELCNLFLFVQVLSPFYPGLLSRTMPVQPGRNCILGPV